MLEVNEIEKGIVIDHITAGNGIKIFNALFQNTSHSVVLLMNARSGVLGKKDIIKVEGVQDVNIDLLGIMDEGVTVNYIMDGKLVKKITAEIPQVITGGIKCQNPRCISHSDDYAVPDFELVSKGRKLRYSCSYCEEFTSVRRARY